MPDADEAVANLTTLSDMHVSSTVPQRRIWRLKHSKLSDPPARLNVLLIKSASVQSRARLGRR